MKGHIFNTPFYTKVNWHDGSIILSRNGQHKGYGEPGSIENKRRISAGRAMNSKYGVTGKVSLNGKIIGKNAFELASDSAMHQTFGGAQKKAEVREQKHAAATARLSGAGSSGRF